MANKAYTVFANDRDAQVFVFLDTGSATLNVVDREDFARGAAGVLVVTRIQFATMFSGAGASDANVRFGTTATQNIWGSGAGEHVSGDLKMRRPHGIKDDGDNRYVQVVTGGWTSGDEAMLVLDVSVR